MDAFKRGQVEKREAEARRSVLWAWIILGLLWVLSLISRFILGIEFSFSALYIISTLCLLRNVLLWPFLKRAQFLDPLPVFRLIEAAVLFPVLIYFAGGVWGLLDIACMFGILLLSLLSLHRVCLSFVTALSCLYLLCSLSIKVEFLSFLGSLDTIQGITRLGYISTCSRIGFFYLFMFFLKHTFCLIQDKEKVVLDLGERLKEALEEARQANLKKEGTLEALETTQHKLSSATCLLKFLDEIKGKRYDSIEDVVRDISLRARGLLDWDIAFLLLCTEDGRCRLLWLGNKEVAKAIGMVKQRVLRMFENEYTRLIEPENVECVKISEDPDLIAPGRSEGPSCFVSSPLRSDTTIRGIFGFGTAEVDAFGGEESRICQVLSSFLSLLITRLSLQERLEEACKMGVKRLSAINEAGGIPGSTNELKGMMHQVLELSLNVLGAEAGSIMFFQDGKWTLEASQDLNKGDVLSLQTDGESVLDKVRTDGTPIVVNDVVASLGIDQAQAKVRSLVSIPLRARGKVFGTLNVAKRSPGSPFLPQDVTFLSAISNLVALGIENLELYSKLSRKVEGLEGELPGVSSGVVAERDRLNLMLKCMGDGVIVIDKSKDIILVNPACEELLGIPKSKLEGHQLTRVENEGILRFFDDLMAGEKRVLARELEYVVPKDRKTKILMGVISKIEVDSKETIGATLVLRDITREKEIDRMKSELVSHVSHELRTPLTSINNSLFILLDRLAGELSEEQKRFLEIIKRNSQRLLHLVNELLDLTRIESGTLKLKIECISIQSVIEDVVSGLKALADEKGLSLSYKVPEVFPDIYLDKQRIEQVLINLVGNAIKFTKPGGRIDIFAKERDEYIEVSVRDTGRGISPVDFDRIFDKFQRLEHPLLHTTEGTGIGLPISKELVKAHHGKIWLKSQPGRGSTFTFSLPKEKRYFLIMAKEQLEIAKAEETNLCIIAMKLDDSSDWLKEEGGLQRLYEIEREMRIRVEREGAVVSYDSKEERLFVLLPRTDKVGGLAVTERLKRAGRGLGLERMETSMALYPDDAEDYDGLMRKAKEGLGMSGRQKEEGDSPGRRV